MIKSMNRLLFEKNREFILTQNNEEYPIYFIIAQPRGVSTLFQQLITSNLDIGYISNFLAKFYRSVAFGLELEKEVVDKKYKSDFNSNYGNTQGVNEPHEWGWFWQDKLNLKDDEHYTTQNNFEELKKSLAYIAHTKQRPLLIDNVYAMANLLAFKKEFTNIKVINLTRDLYFICNSIINARISRYDNLNIFYGHKPHNIDEIMSIQNPIEQVVVQVKSIQNEIDSIVNSFDDASLLKIDYEEIYNDTFEVVNKVHAFILKNDSINLAFKEKHLPKLNYRNDEKLINKVYKEELDFYYKKHFGSYHG